MKIVNLQQEHQLFNATTPENGFGINYRGAGKGFLNKSLNEKAIYCEDISAEIFMTLSNDTRYEFGMFSSWEFIPLSEEIRGEKIGIFIAKYYATGEYDDSRDW